jgi:hypothetical protein
MNRRTSGMKKPTKIAVVAILLAFAANASATVYNLDSLTGLAGRKQSKMAGQGLSGKKKGGKKSNALTSSSSSTTTTTSQSGGNPIYPTLSLDDGLGHTKTLSSASGVISFSGTVGRFTLSLSLTAATGDQMLPTLTLNSLTYAAPKGRRNRNKAGTLTISLSQISLSSPGGTLNSQINGGTSNGSLSYSTYMDTGNTLFGEGTLLTSQGSFATSTFSGVASAALSPLSQFSLTELIVIQQSKNGNTTFSTIITDPPSAAVGVPDTGSTLALLGVALLGIEVVRRKLRAA